MIRILFLLLCLTCYAIGGTYDFEQYTKKRRSASDFVYPYFEISIGAEHSTSELKTESYTHWYHDTEQDKMIYDKNLYYDIYSFESNGPLLDSKLGALLFRHAAIFFHCGIMRFKGDAHYKYYSRDKEEFIENENVVRFYWGVGTKVYPLVKLLPILDGLFIGISLSFISEDNQWDKYGMTYIDTETGFRIETGYLWNISQHYFAGITLNAANYAIGVEKHSDMDDVFELNKGPERDPVDNHNTVQFGIAITVVRK